MPNITPPIKGTLDEIHRVCAKPNPISSLLLRNIVCSRISSWIQNAVAKWKSDLVKTNVNGPGCSVGGKGPRCAGAFMVSFDAAVTEGNIGK
jgi:hypothetical protein